jgi:hypothetical protein
MQGSNVRRNILKPSWGSATFSRWRLTYALLLFLRVDVCSLKTSLSTLDSLLSRMFSERFISPDGQLGLTILVPFSYL